MENSLFTIYPYRHMGGWVFDDENVGLKREPFVAGADDLLSILSEGATQLVVTFATIPFPGHQLRIERIEEQYLHSIGYLDEKDKLPNYGTYYREPTREHLLWLCPALNKYLDPSPETIYIQVKQVENGN